MGLAGNQPMMEMQTAVKSNMLNYIKSQAILSCFLEDNKPFLCMSFDRPFEKSEKHLHRRAHFVKQSLHIKISQSGKENHGSNLFLLRSTIQAHQKIHPSEHSHYV
jgi:hypothetical protein